MPFPRAATGLIAFFLAVVAFQGLAGQARAALSRPTYTAGDRWVYVLEGSLDSFPGMNASQTGKFHFDLVGQVQVDVRGAALVVSGGIPISSVRVEANAVGFLNGTFAVPNLGNALVTGTFTTRTSEFWEDRAYLPIQSNTTTTYSADIKLLITTPFTATVLVDASSSVASIPRFDLEVGQNASAALETHLVENSTVTIAGRTQRSENRTDISSAWRREVLSRERVTVNAGTFTAYKINQTLGSFPGIGGGISGGGNETAYFSNETGYYVKRDAYANGTRVAEMRLKSYSFGASPSSLTLIDWLLLVAAVAVGFILVLMYWKRRKERIPEPPSGVSQSTSSGLKRGGNEGAH